MVLLAALNLHAWITLSSGELVDFTFCSTLAKVFPEDYGQWMGGVACGEEATLFHRHRYYPMLAGRKVFDALQAKSTLPFLAEQVDDLATTQSVIVVTPLS